MPYPTSHSETLADGTVHVIGLALALPAAAVLVWYLSAGQISLTPTLLYLGCLLASLLLSAFYHLSPFDRSRAMLGRLDHAAIYFKIAGTYTPLVALIGTGFAYGVLALVWATALGGAIAKLFFWRIDGRGSLALYLAMGWLSVLLIRPLWHALPGSAVALIVAGGVIYSLGTLIYAHPGLRYQNAIWHIIVLVASACFFAAITFSHGIGISETETLRHI